MLKKIYAVLLVISLLSLSILPGYAIETIVKNQEKLLPTYTIEEVEQMGETDETQGNTENCTETTEESTAEILSSSASVNTEKPTQTTETIQITEKTTEEPTEETTQPVRKKKDFNAASSGATMTKSASGATLAPNTVTTTFSSTKGARASSGNYKTGTRVSTVYGR